MTIMHRLRPCLPPGTPVRCKHVPELTQMAMRAASTMLCVRYNAGEFEVLAERLLRLEEGTIHLALMP